MESFKSTVSLFQSPYGDFGTATLSLSTRSLSGLSGDFFKPKAFFALFGTRVKIKFGQCRFFP